jgi:hypothetical protein
MSSEVETSLDALAFKKKSRFLDFARNDRRRGAVGGLKEILLPVACSVSKLQS